VPTGELNGGEIEVLLTLHTVGAGVPASPVSKSLGVQKIRADKSASAKFDVIIESDAPTSLEITATLNGRKVTSVYPVCPAPVGDVLSKTEKLLADLQQMQGYKDAGMQETLAALKSERERLLRDGVAAADVAQASSLPNADRMSALLTDDEWGRLYEKSLTFRRTVCFRNPLLNFDKLLFVKRHTFQSSHIYTDHFDGSSLMGGNVCVLSLRPDGRATLPRSQAIRQEPHSPLPQVRELAPSLNGGLFGRCDVSFDAKRVVFAYRKPTATPQTIAADAAGAVDGVKDGGFGFHTQNEPNPWWQVDLQKAHALNKIIVYNRTDVVPERAYSLMVLLSDDEKNWRAAYRNEGKPFGGAGDNKPLTVQLGGAQARYVRLQLNEQTWFHLDEVEVYDERGQNVALRKPAKQSSAGQYSRQAQSAAEGFLIYEVNADGAGLRELSHQPDDTEEARQRYRHAYDDMDPCYLPDGRIMFVSTRTKNLVLCHNAFTVTNLHTMDANGKNVEQVSDNPSNEFTPTMMEDGRVLYTRWEYVDKGSGNVQSLWAMRPDGAHSTHVFKNNTDPPVALVDGRQIPGSHKIVTVAAPHMPLTVGPVIIVDDHVTRLTDAALTNVTPTIGYPPCVGYSELEEGYYKDPYPLSEKYFLVSYNFDANPAAPNGYAIYLLDAFGNKELIYRDPTISCFQPMPLVARRKPHILPPLTPDPSPTLRERGVRASPLPQRGRGVGGEGEPQATLLLLDVYRGLTGVKRGAVKYVRVMEDVPKPWGCQNAPAYGDSYGLQNPVVSMGGHFAVKKIHGTVPVAADGSAAFTVPAGKNLYFQALDENFMELQRMRTFVNLMPGETRTCIGCHEPRSESPRNHQAVALRQSKPSGLTPPLWTDATTTVHFPRDVQPTLNKHCVRCHNVKDAQGNLDLSGEETTLFNRAYENLVRKKLVSQVDADPRGSFVQAAPPLTFGSHKSKVVEVIRKGHYGVKLEREEFARLVSWIDANAPYYGTYAGRRNVKWKGTAEYRPEPQE
jgi:hypothetical protein